MSVRLTEKSTIYVACPAQLVTGGPEAMHQLYYKLKATGLNAKMFYFPSDIEAPVADRFLQYNPVFVREIVDNSSNIIIVPEVSTDLLGAYKKIRKAIWWLSVDNYFTTIDNERKLPKRTKLKRFISRKWSFSFANSDADHYYHFAQSKYAYDFLMAKDLSKVFFLSDYLNSSYFEDLTTQEKLNQVLYNPRKGFENTKLLMQACPDIKWVPLENMTVAEVKSVLQASKVYVDFGSHPGKDRFPREAVINGCCVITGRNGSSNFYEDVPISDKFKFQDVATSVHAIIDLIRTCFTEYDSVTKEFDLYREKVLREEEIFEKEIQAIFT